MIPDDVRAHCQLCPHVADGLEAIAAHLAEHGHAVERWPDGGLVIDASQVPELLGGQP